jgi:extradiol dioxygenase family protein
MLKNSPFYAGFAVDDLATAKRFYAETLGVAQVIEIGTGLLLLQAVNGYAVLIYEKEAHEPAKHTILNFPVDVRPLQLVENEVTTTGATLATYTPAAH